MEVTGFRGKGEQMTGYIPLWLRAGPIASLTCFHVVRTKVSYHILLGQLWLHKHCLIPSTYHQCVKGKLISRTIRIAVNLSPFELTEAHQVQTIFYDEWAPSGESSLSRPSSTSIPRWEETKNDPEFDLRELLKRKRKRKEVPTAESGSLVHCIKIKAFDGRIIYKL